MTFIRLLLIAVVLVFKNFQPLFDKAIPGNELASGVFPLLGSSSHLQHSTATRWGTEGEA